MISFAPNQDPVRAEALRAADWVRDTCLIFGSTIETAYKVAGVFAEGMERDPKLQPWRDRTRGAEVKG